MQYEEDFTGAKLEDLVIAVELAVGSRRAGMTKLGSKIIRICEEAIRKDRSESKSPIPDSWLDGH